MEEETSTTEHGRESQGTKHENESRYDSSVPRPSRDLFPNSQQLSHRAAESLLFLSSHGLEAGLRVELAAYCRDLRCSKVVSLQDKLLDARRLLSSGHLPLSSPVSRRNGKVLKVQSACSPLWGWKEHQEGPALNVSLKRAGIFLSPSYLPRLREELFSVPTWSWSCGEKEQPWA